MRAEPILRLLPLGTIASALEVRSESFPFGTR